MCLEVAFLAVLFFCVVLDFVDLRFGLVRVGLKLAFGVYLVTCRRVYFASLAKGLV